MVSNGLNRAFGAGLRRFVARSTSNRFKAMFSGLSVAMGLQSSMAAALIVTSFTARGMVSVSAAIAFMLGADLGSTLAAQILSLDLSFLMPVLITSGFFINKMLSGGQYKHLGRAMIGIGLLLLALKIIVGASETMRQSEVLVAIFNSIESEPFFAILCSALLTWMTHSSLAAVLLFMSLVATNTISPLLGVYFVLGANIGAGIAAYVVSLGQPAAAKRVLMANCIARFIGVVVALPFVPVVMMYLNMIDPTSERLLVNFHTAFNLFLVIAFVPLVGILSHVTGKMITEEEKEDDASSPHYLDDSALHTPQAALACAARETLRVSDLIQRMLRDTLEAFKTNNPSLVKDIRDRDDIVDDLYIEIKNYLARLSQESLDEQEGRKYMQILSFSTNLEHMGDIIDKNLMELASKKIRKHAHFSNEGFEEIRSLHSLVLENMRLAQNIFMTDDLGMARKLVKEKRHARDKEIEASASHLERLRKGVKDTIATSSLHLDILRDLRRINSYITMVAYPLLEEAGELHATRLKKQKLITPEEGGSSLEIRD